MIKTLPNLNSARFGLLGGTFNPIHHGHLAAAEAARHALQLDFVLFVPTGQPPYKPSPVFAEHRYLMTLLATAPHPHFFASRMEMDRPGETYTVDTLRALRKTAPEAQIFFITGADEILNRHHWKDADALPTLCEWVGVTRPGYSGNFPPGVHRVDIPGLDVASTQLREMARQGTPLNGFVPDDVARYAFEMGVYLSDTTVPPFPALHQAMTARLSPTRYTHTLGVVEAAILLAARYAQPFPEAYTAALLHDCAKSYAAEDVLQLCTHYGITPSEMEAAHPQNLLHGPLGAALAREAFGITHPGVLAAIAHHTTGRANMSPLECIIKLADQIEPHRNYPGVDALRALAFHNLEAALLSALRVVVQNNQNKGFALHPHTLEALSFLENARGMRE